MVRSARWYFDADTIGLAKLLRDARRDVTWPGDTGKRTKSRYDLAPCIIEAKDTPDYVWIPKVAAAGMSIVTRDRHILTRTAEINAVLASRARMFAIHSPEQLDNWGMLEVVMCCWREMEQAAREPGPFVYSMTRSGVRRLEIP